MTENERSARRQAARRGEIIQYVGAAVAVIGGILMIIGTTSLPLFVVYFLIFAAGLGAIAYGRKIYTDSLKG